jgi:hypothetical protein
VNAPLPTAIHVEPARYNNANLARFSDWYRDNEPTLTERFELLRLVCSHTIAPPEDFFSFAASQHDFETDRAIRVGLQVPA